MNMKAKCGTLCTDCTFRERFKCPGCEAVAGKPFWGECDLYKCADGKGFAHCGSCPNLPCAMLEKMIAEGHDPRRLENLKAWRDETAAARIQVIAATASDAEDFAFVLCESWKQGYRDILTPEELERNTNYEKRVELFRRLTAQFNGNFFIARDTSDGNRAVGVCSVAASRDADLPKLGELVAIYTLEPYRGMGVGAKLLAAAEARLAELGYADILLWVFDKNPRARRFYEKHGFVFDGTYKDSGFENSREVRYRKRISD